MLWSIGFSSFGARDHAPALLSSVSVDQITLTVNWARCTGDRLYCRGMNDTLQGAIFRRTKKIDDWTGA
jgi:hypothetical protein